MNNIPTQQQTQTTIHTTPNIQNTQCPSCESYIGEKIQENSNAKILKSNLEVVKLTIK